VQYKYVIEFENQLIWESIPENRKVFITDREVTIEDRAGTLLSTKTVVRTDLVQKSGGNLSDLPVRFDETITFSLNDKVIIVSMFLPIQVSKDP
jgi:hypothetical protein